MLVTETHTLFRSASKAPFAVHTPQGHSHRSFTRAVGGMVCFLVWDGAQQAKVTGAISV